MLNFDEFRAVNNREKAKLTSVKFASETISINNKKKEKTKNSEFDEKSYDENMKPISPKLNISFVSSLLESVGEFLELHQMQSVYIFLLLIDTFTALAELYLNNLPNKLILMFIAKASLLKVVRSFSTFALLFFVCEITAVFIVFHSQALGHLGYIVDLVILAIQTHAEMEGHGKYSRLLNILRFWRLFRLFSSMVLMEKLDHQVTRHSLDTTEDLLRQRDSELLTVREDLLKETDARRSVEEMLQSYKDEVDTLNEALKIAAMDIAEVAQTEGGDDDLDYLDDEDDDEQFDEHSALGPPGSVSSGTLSRTKNLGFEDALSSKYSRASNKSTIMRAVMDDNLRRASPANVQSHPSSGHSGAFVVHENGSFEQR
jgi:hypothetical protein